MRLSKKKIILLPTFFVLLSMLVAAWPGMSGSVALAKSQATLVVPTQFPTIQSAVNAASAGDRVQVLSGVYTEQVVINKSLTLVGSGASQTTIEAPSTLSPAEFAPPWVKGFDPPGPRASLVTVTGGAIAEISGFTITGTGQSSCLGQGVDVLRGATLDLHDTTVAHIHNQTPCHGIGILIGRRPDVVTGPPSVGHATISNVIVSDIETYSIRLDGAQSRASISDNTVTGGGTGIDIRHGSARVTYNTITKQFCIGHLALCGPDPINDIQAAGIFGVDVSPGTLISHNEVSDVDVGIYLYGNGITVSHNQITDASAFGYGLQDGNLTVSDSSIEGGGIGVAVAADSVNTVGTIDHVNIANTSGAPVQTFECCGFTATAIINGR